MNKEERKQNVELTEEVKKELKTWAEKTIAEYKDVMDKLGE